MQTEALPNTNNLYLTAGNLIMKVTSSSVSCVMTNLGHGHQPWYSNVNLLNMQLQW